MFRAIALASIALSASTVLRPSLTSAATEAEIDHMTTYAVILGRATGCGIDVTSESARVGKWMDRVFPPGSRDQQIYLPIFIQGMSHHAREQAAGRSPDSCAEMRRQVRTFPWP